MVGLLIEFYRLNWIKRCAVDQRNWNFWTEGSYNFNYHWHHFLGWLCNSFDVDLQLRLGVFIGIIYQSVFIGIFNSEALLKLGALECIV